MNNQESTKSFLECKPTENSEMVKVFRKGMEDAGYSDYFPDWVNHANIYEFPWGFLAEVNQMGFHWEIYAANAFQAPYEYVDRFLTAHMNMIEPEIRKFMNGDHEKYIVFDDGHSNCSALSYSSMSSNPSARYFFAEKILGELMPVLMDNVFNLDHKFEMDWHTT